MTCLVISLLIIGLPTHKYSHQIKMPPWKLSTSKITGTKLIYQREVAKMTPKKADFV